MKKNSGTCIIVEEGNPVYVVTRFDDFEDNQDIEKESRIQDQPKAFEQDLLDKINQEIVNWKSKQAEEEPEIDLPAEEEELTIEKLPVI